MNKANKDKSKLDLSQTQSLEKAISIAKETAKTKFESTVDIDIVLNLKEKNKKESIRGSVDFPNSFGEEKKIIVLADEADAKLAKKAGAVEAGFEDLMEKIEKGTVEFDILIATPSMMPKIIKLGKVLGPRGLMPNPKNGTVTTDVESAVASFKSGKMNFRMEPGQGVVRSKVGKVNQEVAQIEENAVELLKKIFAESRKFAINPFKKVTIKSTMGPSVKVDVNDIINKVK